MTTILLRTLIDALPTPQPHDAIVRVQRWAGRSPAVTFTGDAVTLPDNVLVDLDRGRVEIPATDGRYCIRWTITPTVPGLKPIYRYTSIPIGAAVDFAALQDVDPTTFEPTGETVTAWLAAIAEVTRLQDEIQDTAAQVDADADAAAASANAAQLSRTGAEDAHDAAARYAVDADNYAAEAAQAAAHAAEARDGAETAQARAEAAQADVAASATVASQAAADADADRQAAQTARAESVTARDGAVTARTGAEAARDGALAGQFAGAQVNTVQDVNTFRTPGVFRFTGSGVNSLNLPTANAGVLQVFRVNGDQNVMQEFRVFSGTPARRLGHYERAASNDLTNWDQWRFVPVQRVDQTAGRAIYTQDDLNAREQLIWGDTGWRDVSADLLNGWTGSLFLRRLGSIVELSGQNLVAGTGTQLLAVPVGFRSERPLPIFGRPAASGSPIYGGANGSRIDMSLATAFNSNSLQSVYTTTNAWPATLPGVASGTIPNT